MFDSMTHQTFVETTVSTASPTLSACSREELWLVWLPPFVALIWKWSQSEFSIIHLSHQAEVFKSYKTSCRRAPHFWPCDSIRNEPREAKYNNNWVFVFTCSSTSSPTAEPPSGLLPPCHSEVRLLLACHWKLKCLVVKQQKMTTCSSAPL